MWTGTGVGAYGCYYFLVSMIRYWTTEIVITNKRLIHKRGWIIRNTDEINVNRVEEINLKQGVIGRLFGYGKLTIHGTGIGAVELPNIDDPLEFRSALTTNA